MTLDTLETSIEDSQPVEVYEVRAGSQLFRLAVSQQDEFIGAIQYDATPGLQREKKQEGSDKRDTDFRIRIPTDHPLAQLFTGQLPGFRVTLRVLRFQRADATRETLEVFFGYIQSAVFEKDGFECVLSARNEIAANRGLVPRRTFASLCSYVLFDPDTCRVDDTNPSFRATNLSVLTTVGNVLTVAAGLSGTYPDGWMQGGYVEVAGGTDFRSITSHVGNVLTLTTPLSTPPTTITVFAGCAHDLTTCGTKFANAINFGGWPFVPTRNIFESGLI
jgi:uncharacterized phage protein (TIGR02218 family)